MIRLYTEEQAREMLRQVVRDTHFRTADAIELTYYDGHAERILAAATPATPSQPDLMAVAEAVREACKTSMVGATTPADAYYTVDALDLAPIIAASGTGPNSVGSAPPRKEQKR